MNFTQPVDEWIDKHSEGESMAKAGVKRKKAEEQALPGVEDNKIPEIHQAGAALLDVRERRLALTKEEVAQEIVVVAAMKKNDREYYNVDGLEISVTEGKTKARVKHVASGGGDEE